MGNHCARYLKYVKAGHFLKGIYIFQNDTIPFWVRPRWSCHLSGLVLWLTLYWLPLPPLWQKSRLLVLRPLRNSFSCLSDAVMFMQIQFSVCPGSTLQSEKKHRSYLYWCSMLKCLSLLFWYILFTLDNIHSKSKEKNIFIHSFWLRDNIAFALSKSKYAQEKASTSHTTFFLLGFWY